MVPWLFLAVSLIGASFTISGLVRGRRLLVFVVPYFFAAWLTSELALIHLAWQVVAAVAFVALGAFDAWPRSKWLPRCTVIHIQIGEPMGVDLVQQLTDDELIEQLGLRIGQCHAAARRGRVRAMAGRVMA